MPTVLLVRHGRTAANAQGVLAGWTPGVTLDDKGRQQATELAARLRDVPLAGAVVSPLERTRETAEILLSGRSDVALHHDARLGECDYGDWTGRDLKSLAKEPLWKVVQGHPSAAAFPGGETMAAMQHRAVSAIREWNGTWEDDARYLVVSHGDVIKAILADALGMHLDQFQRIRVDPCSLNVVDYTPTRPFVVRLNDTGGGTESLRARKGARRGKRSSDAVVGGGAGS
jgi:probable phosphomutase (TIGR03848 family)